MWRHASLSILIVASVTGCHWGDPPPAVATAPAESPQVAPAPPEPPPAPPAAMPLPSHKPAQLATTAPVAAVGPDPKQLVGLDFQQTENLLGQPTREEEKPPAKVWVYSGTECDLTIFFYADINTRAFRALTYEVKNHEATEGTDDQCLAQLMQGT